MTARKRGRPRRLWYRRLREEMSALHVTTEDLAGVLKLARSTVSRKLAGHIPWGVDEAYRVLDYMQIPAEKMYLFFPRNGEDAEEIAHHYVQEYLEETNQALVPAPSLDALCALIDGMRRESV